MLQRPGTAPPKIENQKRNASQAGFEYDEDEDDDKKINGRRKIKIEYIEDKSRRHITFSKRKAGIMKKVFFPIGIDSIYRYSTITLISLFE